MLVRRGIVPATCPAYAERIYQLSTPTICVDLTFVNEYTLSQVFSLRRHAMPRRGRCFTSQESDKIGAARVGRDAPPPARHRSAAARRDATTCRRCTSSAAASWPSTTMPACRSPPSPRGGRAAGNGEQIWDRIFEAGRGARSGGERAGRGGSCDPTRSPDGASATSGGGEFDRKRFPGFRSAQSRATLARSTSGEPDAARARTSFAHMCAPSHVLWTASWHDGAIGPKEVAETCINTEIVPWPQIAIHWK